MKHTPAELEAAMNDESEWEAPRRSARPKSERRQRGAVLSVRLTAAELTAIQERAEALGQSVGGYVRTRALSDIDTSGTWPGRAGRTVYAGSALVVHEVDRFIPAILNRVQSSADLELPQPA